MDAPAPAAPLEVPHDDLTPDRIEVDYRCDASSCGATSTWRKEFPDSGFEAVEEMETFFREHLLRGAERRCGTCERALQAAEITLARYRSWSGRVGQELVLEIRPKRGLLLDAYPIHRFYLHRGGELEAVQSTHDPRLRSTMIDTMLRAGALVAEREGSLEDGITLIERAIETDPDYAMARARLGEALFRAGAVDEAEEALRQATARDPGCDVALDLLGQICHGSSRWGEAEAFFQKARLVAGDRADLLLGEARAQVRLGRFDDAFLTALDLRRLDPGSIPGLRLAAVLAQDVEPDRARGLLESMRAAGREHGLEAIAALAEERLEALELPRFRSEVGETEEGATERMVAAFAAAEMELGPCTDGAGARVPGRIGRRGDRTVVLRVFPEGFKGGAWDELVHWLHVVREVAGDALVEVYSPTPTPYGVRKIASALPTARLDVRADELVNASSPAASAEALRHAFPPLVGAAAPGSAPAAALEAIDRAILEGYHDDGFGEMRAPTALLFAHLAGEVIREAVGGDWVPDAPARILETPAGGVDLLAKIGALVTNGPEDSLAYLLEAIRPEPGPEA